MVPKVAINAGSFAFDTKMPFTRPTTQHANIVRIHAGRGSIPPAVINVADIIHDIPATEPIERSIPPVIKTYDCPIPIIIIGTTCLKRFVVLSGEKRMDL